MFYNNKKMLKTNGQLAPNLFSIKKSRLHEIYIQSYTIFLIPVSLPIVNTLISSLLLIVLNSKMQVS